MDLNRSDQGTLGVRCHRPWCFRAHRPWACPASVCSPKKPLVDVGESPTTGSGWLIAEIVIWPDEWTTWDYCIQRISSVFGQASLNDTFSCLFMPSLRPFWDFYILSLTLRLFQIFLKLRFDSTEMHSIERLNQKALKLSRWTLPSNGSTTKAWSLVCDWAYQGVVKDGLGKGFTKFCKESCRMGDVVMFFGWMAAVW